MLVYMHGACLLASGICLACMERCMKTSERSDIHTASERLRGLVAMVTRAGGGGGTGVGVACDAALAKHARYTRFNFALLLVTYHSQLLATY